MTRAEPEPGPYRHYKGDDYVVVAMATDAADSARRVVVYRHMQTGEWYVRSLRSWNSVAPNGQPRFMQIRA